MCNTYMFELQSSIFQRLSDLFAQPFERLPSIAFFAVHDCVHRVGLSEYEIGAEIEVAGEKKVCARADSCDSTRALRVSSFSKSSSVSFEALNCRTLITPNSSLRV